jgi:hypothetical protein
MVEARRGMASRRVGLSPALPVIAAYSSACAVNSRRMALPSLELCFLVERMLPIRKLDIGVAA